MLHNVDDEISSDVASLYLFIAAIVGLIVCTVLAYSELQYMSSGRIAGARVENMHTVHLHPRRGSDYDVLSVTYTINENSLTRHEIEEVDPDWYTDHPNDISADGKTIQVQYLPGNEGRSRLLGHSYRWVMIPLAISIAFIICATTNFWRGYAAYQRRLAEERR